MFFVDEFTDELTALIESTIGAANEHADHDAWRGQLRTNVRNLVDKYGGNNRARGPSFVIGDESSSTSASFVQEALVDAEVQVDLISQTTLPPLSPINTSKCVTNVKNSSSSSEEEKLLMDLREGRLKHRMLEQRCSSPKAVVLRRLYMEECLQFPLDSLPFEHYDYSEVKDACCENVIGYVPIPTGVAGPLHFEDNELLHIPMSTTEGALIASVSRGCLCLNQSIKVLGRDALFVQVIRDGMTRAPVLEFDRISSACECYKWIQREDTFARLKRSFEETSSFACLKKVEPHLEGNYLFLRFVASTGDAMGMNMVTKGTGRALALIQREFPQATLLSISGNFCVDKKPSALNWIEGRGKSVVAEAFVPALVVERVLKTSVERLVKLGNAKLLVGSSAAITIGGWNAHAANIVTAMFLATGQDAAQVISSSMCFTQLSKRSADGALHISCTMNCLEVGTIGGGTVLSPQGACLQMLGCRQKGLPPGQNAERLARIICATVLAGELSLLASQCNEGELERTHLKLNRSSRNLVLSGSSYPLTSPSTSSQTLMGSPESHKKSNSVAAFPEPIPEHRPIPPIAIIPEVLEKTRSSTTTTACPPVEESSTREKPRSRTTLGQTGTKLLKKANSGRMPCGPL